MRKWSKGDIEEPDQTPVEIPTGMKEPETLEQIMGRMLGKKLADAAQEQGFDSFEEDQDFEDEDPNLLNFTPYEFDELEGDVIADPERPSEPLEEGEQDPSLPPEDASPRPEDPTDREVESRVGTPGEESRSA